MPIVASNSCQCSAAAAGGLKSAESVDRIGAFGHMVEEARRRTWADTGQELRHAESGDAVADVLRPAQYRQHVLDMRSLKEFETAELHERNVAARELDFEAGAVMRGAEQALPATSA